MSKMIMFDANSENMIIPDIFIICGPIMKSFVVERVDLLMYIIIFRETCLFDMCLSFVVKRVAFSNQYKINTFHDKTNYQYTSQHVSRQYQYQHIVNTFHN